MSTSVGLLISVLLIAVNGFFVGTELAFVASRRTKLEALAENGVRGARVAVDSVTNLTRQLFAAQLGITIATLILGLIAEDLIAQLLISAFDSRIDVSESLLHDMAVVVAILIVVFFHTVFGEMVPKNIAIAQPETAARFLAPIHAVFVTIVSPIIWVLKQLSRPLLHLAGVDPNTGLNRASTPVELVRMIDASRDGGLVEEQEHALLTGALDFGDIRVRSVMIPIGDIVSVPLTATVSDVEALVVAHGHSRIPVMQASGMDFRGFVHAKDLVRLPAEATGDIVPLELIRRMPKVTIEQTVEDLLLVMKGRRRHMALVTANDVVVGMATLEDVLEELVGEIYDETDQE
ncbi:MAG: CBS domain containing-hemolysin-like protein [Verrucomicrobiales bacterium]|jgi:CBS domain containing-hemolysin-like protein